MLKYLPGAREGKRNANEMPGKEPFLRSDGEELACQGN